MQIPTAGRPSSGPPQRAGSKQHAWLLDHGADINQRATFGGPQHGLDVTALHLAAQNDNFEMVRFLVEHGADPTIKDALYESTPAGWAAHSNATAVAAYLNGLTP